MHQTKASNPSGHARNGSNGPHNMSNQWIIDEVPENNVTNPQSEEHRDKIHGLQSSTFEQSESQNFKEVSSKTSSMADPFSRQRKRTTRFKYDPETDKIQMIQNDLKGSDELKRVTLDSERF